MKISTCIDSIAKTVGDEGAIRLVAEAGFDCFDLSLFKMAPFDYRAQRFTESDHPFAGEGWQEYALRLRRLGEELGITCNQSHAPFPSVGEEAIPILERAIEITGLAGGKVCVIHPYNYHSAEQNAVLYRRLLPTAHRAGVRIATENMWNWDRERDIAAPAACSHHDDFLAHIKAVDDPYLVACVDIGHAEMAGLSTDAPTMLRTLGKHVQALHVHDNDLHHDSHALPYTMGIDFDGIARTLAEIDYRGEITLEACYHRKDATAEEQPARVAELAAAARRLADAVESYRAK